MRDKGDAKCFKLHYKRKKTMIKGLKRRKMQIESGSLTGGSEGVDGKAKRWIPKRLRARAKGGGRPRGQGGQTLGAEREMDWILSGILRAQRNAREGNLLRR